MSEGGFTVVQLPHDWVDGNPVNQDVYRDMQGLSNRISNEQEKIGGYDALSDITRRRYDAEVDIENNFWKKTGQNFSKLSPKEQEDVRLSDPEFRAAQDELNNYFRSQKAIQADIAQTLPTLNSPQVAAVPETTSPEVTVPNASKAGGAITAGLNAGMGALGMYQGIRDGKPVEAGIGGANLLSGTIVATKQLAPGLVRQEVVQAAELTAIPLIVLSSAYDIATAKDKGLATGKAMVTTSVGLATGAMLTTSEGGAIAFGASTAGVVGGAAVAFVLPAAAAVAAGYYFEKDCKLTEMVHQSEARIADIQANNTNHSHLQAIAETMEHQPHTGDFRRTSDGRIDLHNPDNLRALNDYMAQQRIEVQQAMDKNEQIGAFPEAIKNGNKESAYYTLKETKKTLDVATSELNTINAQIVAPVNKTQDEMKADLAKIEADAKQGKNTVELSQYTYTNRDGTLVPADDRNPALSKEALDCAKQNGGVGREILYSPDGKPMRVITYNIEGLPDVKSAVMDAATSQATLTIPPTLNGRRNMANSPLKDEHANASAADPADMPSKPETPQQQIVENTPANTAYVTIPKQETAQSVPAEVIAAKVPSAPTRQAAAPAM